MGSLRACRWPLGHRPPPLRRLGLWPGGDLYGDCVATFDRSLRERVLRTLPETASIVSLARAIGKYQIQFAYCSFRHVGLQCCTRWSQKGAWLECRPQATAQRSAAASLEP